jgi:negative regulator of sigma E activity
LKKGLARREPPADFTSKVLARVEAEERRHHAARDGRTSLFADARLWRTGLSAWFQRGRAWGLAGAVAGLLAISGTLMYEQHERTIRGEAAKQQLLTAVRIAAVKLHQVHRHVLEVEAEVDQ